MSGDRVKNLRELQRDHETIDAPAGHAFKGTSFTESFGSVATGMGVYELAPGSSAWPYHFEIGEEEWLIVIEGEVTLRTPEGEQVLRAGDVVCFPAGAAGAHALRNHSDAPVHYAMPSTRPRYGGATVYLDSGKVNVYGPGYRHRGWIGEAAPYWEGEP
ncbi:MAG TPA: cupin domain-containing protein [Gaiellaceae bacterium]|nr:cupin domain-containing protein [Gaiellaceae bacterium]